MPAIDPERVAMWPTIRSAYLLLRRAIASDLERERSFPLDEFELLVALMERRGRARMADLLAELAFTKSNLTRLVDRAEDADLVSRERDADDRRVVHVVATRFGRDEYRRVLPAYQRSVTRHVSAISDSDIHSLHRAMLRASERLRAAEEISFSRE